MRLSVPSPRLGAAPVEVAWALLVLVAAMLVRLPYLQDIPRFTDEATLWLVVGNEMGPGSWPLVFEDTGYNGALPLYALYALRLFSQSVIAPRWLALVAGSLSVLFLYLTGRRLAGRRAGLIAAAGFGLSLTPLVVYSHIWHTVGAACFFQLLAWWAAAGAVTGARGSRLALAGLLGGLAAQTHPLSAAFLPGLAAWIALEPKGRRLLRGRWGALALAGLAIGYSPIPIYHLLSWLNTGNLALAGVVAKAGPTWHEVGYATGLGNLLVELGDALGSRLQGPDQPAVGTSLALALVGIAVLASLHAARRGQSLALFLCVSGLLGMPLLIRHFDTTLPGRYTGLLLPALYLGLGLGANAWIEEAVEASRRRARLWVTVLALGLLLVVLGWRVGAYYQAELAAGRSNDAYFRTLRLVGEAEARVVLDGDIRRLDGRGSGPSAVLPGIFTWAGIDYNKRSSDEALKEYLLAISWPAHAILADETVAAMNLPSNLELLPGGHFPARADMVGWGVYVWDPP